MTYQEICAALRGEQMKKEAGMRKEALKANVMSIFKNPRISGFLKTLRQTSTILPGHSFPTSITFQKGIFNSKLQHQLDIMRELLNSGANANRLIGMKYGPAWRPNAARGLAGEGILPRVKQLIRGLNSNWNREASIKDALSRREIISNRNSELQKAIKRMDLDSIKQLIQQTATRF